MPKSSEQWSCRELKGTIAEVVKRFQDYKVFSDEEIKAGASPDANIRGIIPDEDRPWIIRKIQSKAKFGWNGVIVDVHDHAPDNADDVGGWKISKLY